MPKKIGTLVNLLQKLRSKYESLFLRALILFKLWSFLSLGWVARLLLQRRTANKRSSYRNIVWYNVPGSDCAWAWLCLTVADRAWCDSARLALQGPMLNGARIIKTWAGHYNKYNIWDIYYNWWVHIREAYSPVCGRSYAPLDYVCWYCAPTISRSFQISNIFTLRILVKEHHWISLKINFTLGSIMMGR